MQAGNVARQDLDTKDLLKLDRKPLVDDASEAIVKGMQ